MLRAFIPLAIIASILSGCSGEKPAAPGRTSATYVRKEPKAVAGGTETLLEPANPDPNATAYKITDKTLPDGTHIRSVNPAGPGKD